MSTVADTGSTLIGKIHSGPWRASTSSATAPTRAGQHHDRRQIEFWVEYGNGADSTGASGHSTIVQYGRQRTG